MLGDLASGRILEDPFPPEQTQRLRDFTAEITKEFKLTLGPGERAQPQPVDVLLLGAVLRAIGDPDWEVLKTYAVGVPLGLGVEMPRTPKVPPPKVRWSLKEQLE